MDSKVSEKDMREVYFQAFGKEYDSADRKQAPLPLEIAYLTALNKLKREGKYAGGGEITDDAYYQSVNHFVYFCMNYPNDFLDAFGNLKTHLSNKFKDYYNKYGTYGVMIHFYTELDSENRRILTDYSFENYKGTPISSDVSEVEYFNSVNHFIYFCFNFPSNFMDAFSSHLKVHLSSKWTNAYEKKGSVGAMIYFWSELDGENRRKLATWSKNNYTGTKLYEVGGALGDVAGMLPSPLPMSTIQAMADGGQLELFADGGGVADEVPLWTIRDYNDYLVASYLDEKKLIAWAFQLAKENSENIEINSVQQAITYIEKRDKNDEQYFEVYENYADGGGVDYYELQDLKNKESVLEKELHQISDNQSDGWRIDLALVRSELESVREEISKLENKYADGGGVDKFPPKGELTNKDNFLLKYEKKGSDYEFFVYKPITKEVSGYNQIKHVCLNKDCPQKMTYEQFINYLYVELYLDDNKYSDGGGVDDDVLVGQVYLNTTNNSYIIIDKVEDSKEAYPSVYYHTYNQPQSYRNSNIDRISFFEDLVDSGVFVLQSDKMENGGVVGEIKITKNEVQFREDEPHRVYHWYEGTLGRYVFYAQTDNSFKGGYGSDGINKGSIYKLSIRKVKENGTHESIAEYWNKWDYRTKNVKDGAIRGKIIKYLDSISDERIGSPKKYKSGGGVEVGDVVEVKEPNYGRDRDYYVVADKVGYDKDGFLISDVNKREGDVFEEEQLKKLYTDGGVVIYKETDLNRRDGKTKKVQVTRVDSYREALERIEELKRKNKNPNVSFFTGDIYANGGGVKINYSETKTNGSLVKGANFENGLFVNFTKLHKIYKEEYKYGIYDASQSEKIVLFKTLEDAEIFYEQSVKRLERESSISKTFSKDSFADGGGVDEERASR